jgi:hypothetical protein
MIHRDQILDTTINPLYYKGSFKKIYEKNILINRKQYCDWIDDLSKKNYKNIFWWFLNPVSRNLYYENLLILMVNYLLSKHYILFLVLIGFM